MIPIRDTIPSRNPIPLATTAIILFNAVVFWMQLRLSSHQLEQFVYTFGLVPRRFTHPAWAVYAGFPDNYWPFLTSMFLHGGWLHIIGNMWTLWIFGDNVEERMGSIRFLVFYLVTGMVSGIVYTVANGPSTTPCLGASGAIAGVLAAYAFMFPMARIICLVPIFFFPLFIRIHAFVYMFIWFFLQFFNGTMSLFGPQQTGGVAWMEHVGGFIFGLVAYRFFLPRRDRGRPMFRDEYGIEGA